jgi:ADP-ribose pyrophosphatase YjhB (NUDIX family)
LSTEIYTQAGVIPYRFDSSGRPEILLIRRLEKEKWGIPKGMVGAGVSLEDTARAEAAEEAGVGGELSDQPVGFFSFRKWEGMVHVTVYLMRVTEVLDEYPESYRREREWFPFNTAVETAGRRMLRELLMQVPRMIREHFPDTCR